MADKRVQMQRMHKIAFGLIWEEFALEEIESQNVAWRNASRTVTDRSASISGPHLYLEGINKRLKKYLTASSPLP